jgi:hypothetical protein
LPIGYHFLENAQLQGSDLKEANLTNANLLFSRFLMLLMLKVATFTKPLSALYLWVCLPKGATEFVVPAGIILPVGTNGKPRTKTQFWRSPLF